MEQTFDFEKNGKQMPYTVPDGFFDTLEENVMKEWKEESGMEREKKRAKTIRIAIRTVLAIAACLALFFIVRQILRIEQHTGLALLLVAAALGA